MLRAGVRTGPTGQAYWDEWGLCRDGQLLNDLGAACCRLVSDDCSVIVSLGRSGLFLGPLLSLAKDKPMQAAASEHLAADQGGPFVLLGDWRAVGGERVSMVDSHRHTGRTHRRYGDFLTAVGAEVRELAVAVDFDICGDRSGAGEVRSLVRISECLSLFARVVGVQSEQEAESLLEQVTFWAKPEPQAPARPEHLGETGGRSADSRLIDTGLADVIGQLLVDRDDPQRYRNVWGLYCNPGALRDACEAIVRVVDEFDVVAAYSVWGTPLATGVSKAVYDRSGRAVGVAHVGDERCYTSLFYGTREEVEGKRVLLCDDFIGTGQHALQMSRALERLGAQVAAVVVVFENTAEHNRTGVAALVDKYPLFALTNVQHSTPRRWRRSRGPA